MKKAGKPKGLPAFAFGASRLHTLRLLASGGFRVK
jgi:hypothetical protein